VAFKKSKGGSKKSKNLPTVWGFGNEIFTLKKRKPAWRVIKNRGKTQKAEITSSLGVRFRQGKRGHEKKSVWTQVVEIGLRLGIIQMGGEKEIKSGALQSEKHRGQNSQNGRLEFHEKVGEENRSETQTQTKPKGKSERKKVCWGCNRGVTKKSVEQTVENKKKR